VNSVPTTDVRIHDDGETIDIALSVRDRSLHRLVTAAGDNRGAAVVVEDALHLGAEMLSRVGQHGDLQNFAKAVERIDKESQRIVETTEQQITEVIGTAAESMLEQLTMNDGPLAGLLERFDTTAEGNVIDQIHSALAEAMVGATSRAVRELGAQTHELIQQLTKTIGELDRVAAAEAARADEAAVGTRKGIAHELDVEQLLGELIGAAGDSLDDVSTVVGVAGTKKGDKTITPRGGCMIVTEEKCTQRLSESKIRELLAAAMANRAAELGMLIVEDESKVPGRQPFHFIDDDKVVVVAERSALRVVYLYLRVRSLEIERRRQVSSDDTDELLEEIARAADRLVRGLKQFKTLRTEHTKAATAIRQAERFTDDIAEGLEAEVRIISELADRLSNDDQVAA
jgi:hypothetical protein